MHRKDALGRLGENLAADHLTHNGWRILARNWRCDIGEIDIVAWRDEVLVICEVKTRSSTRFGGPLEAVDAVKLGRLRRLAARWMAEHGMRAQTLRIDVIAILFGADHAPQLRHVEAVG